MDQPKVHWPAILVAASVQWVIGMVWYMSLSGPWMAANNLTMESSQKMLGTEIGMLYVGAFIAYIVTFYVMAHFIHYTGAKTPKAALQAGFWLWLGFTATSLYVSFSFAMKPFSLWLIDGGYWLLSMLAGAVILVKIRPNTAAA